MPRIAASAQALWAMEAEQWEFLLAGDYTWTWRRVAGSYAGTCAPFSDFGVAVSDAVTQGFVPERQYWLVKSNGRTTHFRPGYIPVNFPAGENPQD